MAIMFDNKYYKIISTTSNFVDDTTEIEMDVYGSKETRDHEKKFDELKNEIISKIHLKLEENMINLIKKTEKIKPIDEITDPEAFYKEHPEIKNESDFIQSIHNEGLYIMDKLLKENINYDDLKHKDYWIELGLTKQLCQAVDYKGTFTIGLDGVRTNNLSNLYSGVKEKVVSEVIDC